MNEVNPLTGEIALSKFERLSLCEQRIVNGLSDSWDAWREIDTDCLYEGQYENWDDYCRKKWQFSGSRGWQMLAASKIISEVASAGVVITKERAARAIIAIAPEKRLSVVLAAKETFGERLTSGMIQSASEVMNEAIQTNGYVDVGDGQMRALHAAIGLKEEERLERQRQHARDGASAANGTTHDQRVSLGTFQIVETANVDGLCYVSLRVSAEVLAQVREGQVGGGVIFLKPEVKPDA